MHAVYLSSKRIMAREKEGNHLIAIRERGHLYKVCRIVFAKDGSYFVNVNYHNLTGARVLRMMVNYEAPEALPISDALDIGVSTKAYHQLKFSHHASGFAQFSGTGIVSGRDPTSGAIRGIGVDSFSPLQPQPGPAFGMRLAGVDRFEPIRPVQQPTCIFGRDDLAPFTGTASYCVEGLLFEAQHVTLVETSVGGTKSFRTRHPNGKLMRLRAVLPPASLKLPYFMGLRFYALRDDLQREKHSLIFSGPTGNLRRNGRGQRIGDGIFCHFPATDSDQGRSLDFEPSPAPGEPAV